MRSTGTTSRGRIAVVLPALLPLAGVERLTVTLIAEFLARGHDVDLVLIDEPNETGGVVPPGTRVVNLAVPKLRKCVGPLARYLREVKPDAVLVSLWPLTCLCLVAHRLARSKASIVVCEHNTISKQYPSPIERLRLRASLAATYRFATGHVCVSGGVARDIARLSGLDRGRFTVIHNPISLRIGEGAQDDGDSIWHGLTGSRILAVGILKAQKNHALLIRAFRTLLESVDACLVIAGTGSLAASLEALACAENVAHKIRWAGYVTNPVPLYKTADLFVFSSDYEGFGNVIVEALACGCPVVSTDCPSGPAEILENGRWGLLTPVGDSDALAKAMAEAIAADHDREALKRRAADFSPGKAAERYLDLLLPESVTRDRQPASAAVCL